jgi:hypothetical protein
MRWCRCVYVKLLNWSDLPLQRWLMVSEHTWLSSPCICEELWATGIWWVVPYPGQRSVWSWCLCVEVGEPWSTELNILKHTADQMTNPYWTTLGTLGSVHPSRGEGNP